MFAISKLNAPVSPDEGAGSVRLLCGDGGIEVMMGSRIGSCDGSDIVMPSGDDGRGISVGCGDVASAVRNDVDEDALE